MMFTREMIKKILCAIDIKKGQVILLQFWGEDNDREVLHNFSYEVATFGATPMLLQHSRTNYTKLFETLEDGCFDENYFRIFDAVDVVIDLCMYRAVMTASDFPKEKLPAYKKFMGQLFETLVKKEKFVQIRIPTKENAIESGLPTDLYIEKMTKAYDIDYVDLKKNCNMLVERIAGKNNVIIQTGEDCELVMSLADRKWFVDAGDGDLPCGEIGIAPMEGMTNGTVYFDKLYIDGQEENQVLVEQVILTVENGIIKSSNSERINDFLKELPSGGDVVCELGLGMNPNIKELVGYPLLDEKMIGTFHIGIGRNDMFGGNNISQVHMDFVGSGKVIINEDVVL